MLKTSNCETRGCKFYIGILNDSEPFSESKEVNYCEAFPKGIPDEIAYGDNDHTKPFKGDNGIQYQKEEQNEK